MSFLLLCALAVSGCGQASEPKTVAELQAEIAEKQVQIERVKETGRYPDVILPAVCVRGVLYYSNASSSMYRVYTPAIDKNTLLPERCNGK